MHYTRFISVIPLGLPDELLRPWHLFPLPVVETQIRRKLASSPTKNPARNRALAMKLERLPYCIGGGFWAVLKIGSELKAAAERHGRPNLPASEEVRQSVLEADETLFVRHAVDSFLEIGSRTQDAVLDYISASYEIKVPEGLNGCVRELQCETLPLPPALRDCVLRYWDASGQRLRNYRNRSQHQGVVASEAVIVSRHGAPNEVALFLPGNPEEREPSKWVFGEGGTLAYPYCTEAYLELFGFAYEVLFILARHLGYTEQFSRLVTFRAPIGPVPFEAHAIPEESELETRLLAWRRELKDRCTASHGHITDPSTAE